MPEKSGVDFLHEIQMSPYVPVVLCTRYTEVYGRELARFSVNVLRKPYSPRKLLNATAPGLRLRKCPRPQQARGSS